MDKDLCDFFSNRRKSIQSFKEKYLKAHSGKSDSFANKATRKDKIERSGRAAHADYHQRIDNTPEMQPHRDAVVALYQNSLESPPQVKSIGDVIESLIENVVTKDLGVATSVPVDKLLTQAKQYMPPEQTTHHSQWAEGLSRLVDKGVLTHGEGGKIALPSVVKAQEEALHYVEKYQQAKPQHKSSSKRTHFLNQFLSINNLFTEV